MGFTENKGQVVDLNQELRPDVLFKGDGAAAEVYIRKTGISYVFSNLTEIINGIDAGLEQQKRTQNPVSFNEQKAKRDLLKKAVLKIQRIDFDFTGCNTAIETITSDRVEEIGRAH